MKPMRDRWRAWLWQWLIAVDQLAAVWLCGWAYVLFARGDCPSADETISSIVGRHATARRRWALRAELAINWLFVRLGDEPDHCRRSIEWDEVPASESPAA